MQEIIKRKKVNKVVAGCVFAVCFGGPVLASEEVSEDLFATPFEGCLFKGNDASELNHQEAYDVAMCFDALLSAKGANIGASLHTVQQYSASWYAFAVEKGHEAAAERLSQSLLALQQIESASVGGAQGAGILPSEQRFKKLDLDGDGVLSLAEAGDLSKGLGSMDIDNDGLISFGEFSIGAGEATAAGN
jgi:hypothetical protein